jgi:hypothetical protein
MSSLLILNDKIGPSGKYLLGSDEATTFWSWNKKKHIYFSDGFTWGFPWKTQY